MTACFALAWMGNEPLRAQQAPAAVIADPPVDKEFPPGVVGITVPSHGVDMDATFYLAAGAGPHGTVLLLHGLPGYEHNGDLAQSIRRGGWNVLLFHYRGTWGTPGTFSTSSALEDTVEAVRFLRDPANVAKYRIDPRALVVIGHSFGGFVAGYEGSHDHDIRAVGMIAAVNLGQINRDPKERESRLQRWAAQLHPVHGTTASKLFAEAERHAKDWDYVSWADALRERPALLVEADDQNHADMEALAAAMRQKGSVALEHVAVATDHGFSDHRIALQTIVIHWLEGLMEPSLRPISVTSAAELDHVVGKLVTLRGTVTASRVATLVGVDVESTAPDLRGQPAIATGRLERTVVTQAELDRQTAEQGQFAHRGPGTYYRLVDPRTGALVQIQSP